MNTEQLTQFPMGVITETDVKEHKAVTQVVSEDVKTWTKMVVLTFLGTVAVGMIGAFYMSAGLSPQMSRLECTKAILMTWLTPERGADYITAIRNQ